MYKVKGNKKIFPNTWIVYNQNTDENIFISKSKKKAKEEAKKQNQFQIQLLKGLLIK